MGPEDTRLVARRCGGRSCSASSPRPSCGRGPRKRIRNALAGGASDGGHGDRPPQGVLFHDPPRKTTGNPTSRGRDAAHEGDRTHDGLISVLAAMAALVAAILTVVACGLWLDG